MVSMMHCKMRILYYLLITLAGQPSRYALKLDMATETERSLDVFGRYAIWSVIVAFSQ